MKRYSMRSVYNTTACEDQVRAEEDTDGEWVRYKEAREENERLRKALEELYPFAIVHEQDCVAFVQPDAEEQDYLDRLKSAITAAREAMKGVEE